MVCPKHNSTHTIMAAPYCTSRFFFSSRTRTIMVLLLFLFLFLFLFTFPFPPFPVPFLLPKSDVKPGAECWSAFDCTDDGDTPCDGQYRCTCSLSCVDKECSCFSSVLFIPIQNLIRKAHFPSLSLAPPSPLPRPSLAPLPSLHHTSLHPPGCHAC